MAPFIVLAPTDEAFAAALEALGVTAEELLARDDLADVLLIHPAGRHRVCAILKTRSSGSLAAGEAGGASVHGNRLGANCWLGLVVVGRQAAVTTAELVKPNSPRTARMPA